MNPLHLNFPQYVSFSTTSNLFVSLDADLDQILLIDFTQQQNTLLTSGVDSAALRHAHRLFV